MSGPVAQYPIIANIRLGRVDPAPALPGLDQVEEKTKEIERSALGIGPAFLAAGAAIAAGLALGVTKAITLGTEMETAQGNIASLFMSLEGLEATAAQQIGKTVVQQLTEDAAKGVGELQNYLDTYQQIYAPARSGGASVDDIRRLTKLTVTAGFGLQGARGLINAPLDIQQALTSGVGDRTTPIALAALRTIGMSGSEFNKLSTDKRISALMEGFGSFEGAADMMGQTVEAQMATASDAIKGLYRQASAPIFEGFKRGLQGSNRALEDNEDTLDQFTGRLAGAAEGIGVLVERAVTGATELGIGIAEAPNWEDSRLASEDLTLKLRQTGFEVRDFGRGLGYVLAELQGTASGLAADALEAGFTLRESLAQSSMLSMQAAGGLLGLLGFDRQFVAPDYQQAYGMLGLPTSPDSDISEVTQLLAQQARKADQDSKKPKKITVELKTARIEWGNDRSMVRALEPMLAEVADRAARLSLESSLSAPMGE